MGLSGAVCTLNTIVHTHMSIERLHFASELNTLAATFARFIPCPNYNPNNMETHSNADALEQPKLYWLLDSKFHYLPPNQSIEINVARKNVGVSRCRDSNSNARADPAEAHL